MVPEQKQLLGKCHGSILVPWYADHEPLQEVEYELL